MPTSASYTRIAVRVRKDADAKKDTKKIILLGHLQACVPPACTVGWMMRRETDRAKPPIHSKREKNHGTSCLLVRQQQQQQQQHLFNLKTRHTNTDTKKTIDY